MLEHSGLKPLHAVKCRPGQTLRDAECAQAVFLLIGKTSALTMNIAGVIKDWMLIFFSYYVFGAPVTAVNLLGYVFCCSGVMPPLSALHLADITQPVGQAWCQEHSCFEGQQHATYRSQPRHPFAEEHVCMQMSSPCHWAGRQDLAICDCRWSCTTTASCSR